MNTTEIIHEIARRSKNSRDPLTRYQVKHVLNLFTDIVTEELTQPDGVIRIRHIGILKVKKRRYSGGQLRVGQYASRLQDNLEQHYYRVTFRISQILAQQLNGD